MPDKLMMANRQVGTLWCTEVLARLSDYLDGELTAEARHAVEIHVAGCDNCRRFGGDVGAMVAALGRHAPGEARPGGIERLLWEWARGKT